MDPLTHAASGAVAMLCLPRRPATFWAAPLAAIACASPDIDLAFIRTPIEFLMLHRGLTHSFAFMPIFAAVLALLAWPLWRKTTPLAWSFAATWLFCCGMILLHIWLDVVTTYGTMVFLPFSHYRVRLNSIYMIDLLVTVPLLWAVWRWRARRQLLLLTLAWTFFYPAAGIVVNAWHDGQWRDHLRAQGRQVEQLHILPDFLAPFFWRVLYEEERPDGLTVVCQSVNAIGAPRAPEERFPSAEPPLVARLMRESLAADVYFHFAMLPTQRELASQYLPGAYPESARFLMFYDLRFGSGLEFVRRLLALRPNAGLPFLFMAELLPDGGGSIFPGIGRIRLRFADSGRDSGWHAPRTPEPPTPLQWLVGLR